MATKRKTRPVLKVKRLTPVGDLVVVKPGVKIKTPDRRFRRLRGRPEAMGLGTVMTPVLSGLRDRDGTPITMPKLRKGDRVAFHLWYTPEIMQVGEDLVYLLKADQLIGKVVD